MKVGLFFGTFNPIHHGHLILANFIYHHSDLNQIWYVVTPQSPDKKHQKIEDDYTRLHMVNLAIEPYPFLKATDVEFKLPTPNYTYITLVKLKELYPLISFSMIMGEDNYTHLHSWEGQDIIQTLPIYIYPRRNDSQQTPQFPKKKVTLVKAPRVEISSSMIRQSIQKHIPVDYLLPSRVATYIGHTNLYKN